MSDPGGQAQADGLNVASRLVRLDPGLFSLTLVPSPMDRGDGLPGVRVSLPPGPAARREAAILSLARGDGWQTVTDEPTLIRAGVGGAEVMVTLYWRPADGPSPSLRLARLNGEEAAQPGTAPHAPAPGMASGGFPFTPASTAVAPSSTAEIVAHVQGVGDVEGRVGEWIGTRGSGRAIEGFSLTPRQAIAVEDYEIRAVLGRDWLSPWLPGGHFCGSRGLALPLRGFCLRLRPTAAVRFDLNILARFVDGSEVGPVSADRICAASSLSPLEAFQVLVRPRAA